MYGTDAYRQRHGNAFACFRDSMNAGRFRSPSLRCSPIALSRSPQARHAGTCSAPSYPAFFAFANRTPRVRWLKVICLKAKCLPAPSGGHGFGLHHSQCYDRGGKGERWIVVSTLPSLGLLRPHNAASAVRLCLVTHSLTLLSHMIFRHSFSPAVPPRPRRPERCGPIPLSTRSP